MQIRLECTIDGLTNNWVDVAEVWTRSEMRRWHLATLGAAPEDELFALLAEKLVACHVYLPDGALLTTADQLIARFDDLDARLVRWLATGLSKAIQELLALGERQKRLLFDGVEVAVMTTKTTPTAT